MWPYTFAFLLLQTNRQIERAAEAESVPAHAGWIGQGHVREALEQHGQQNHADGSPRQMPACAMMRTVAERLMRIGFAQPVIVLAVLEDILVAVGRCLDRHHGVTLRNQATTN